MSKKRFNHLKATRDEIRTLEFNKSKLSEKIASHNDAIEKIKKQVKKENDKISLYIRNAAMADDSSLKKELRILRKRDFEGMTADNFMAKFTIEKSLEIKALNNNYMAQLIMLALCIGGGILLIEILDNKIGLVISVIYMLSLIIGIIGKWQDGVRIKKKLSGEPFSSHYISHTFQVLKKEESIILDGINSRKLNKAEISRIPDYKLIVVRLEKKLAKQNEKNAEMKNEINDIDKQIAVAWDSIKEMIPYSNRLKLE